ncbi:MAG: nuclear transport factor 2 family protein [Pseudomonadota bacterium]
MITAPHDPQAFYANSMAAAPDAVRGFYTALTQQDARKLRMVLSDEFTFESPLASFDSPESFIQMVGSFGGWVETSRIIVDGDQVAHTFTYHMTAPGKADIPMCEVFELKGGKLVSSRAYNNPADFPS